MTNLDSPGASPRFSVVIPTYNRAATVIDTLESCFAQDFKDFEIIVVDDGSADDTLKVLQGIMDERLVVVSQANAGPAAARNHGMRKACGQYIAFLDSDDRWYPDFLQSVDTLLQREGEVLVYGQIIVDRGVGRYWIKPDRAMEPAESIYDFLYVHGGFIQTSTMVVPRALCEKVQWDEKVTYGDNDQFAIDCWQSGIRFCMLPKAGTHYADFVSEDALSQLPIFAGTSEKYTNLFRWMLTQKPLMSAQAWAGYQARVESVSYARQAPLKSFRMLWAAKKLGAISLKGIVRQTVQNLLPRAYRRLVDNYVRLRGSTLDELRGEA